MKSGAHKLVPFNSLNSSITEGVIWKEILKFFFPILLGTFFQQLYNTADAIIVGRFLGKEALAAVGGGTGTVVHLLVGFFTGLSSGATVIISQFYGAKNTSNIERAVHTSIALAIGGGVIMTISGILLTPSLLKLIGTPQEILNPAIVYIKIFFGGILPTIIYNMGSGILRAIGDSKRPFYFLIIGTILNICLDLLFIAVFNWGVQGAAFATIISQTVTMLLVLICLTNTTECYKLTIKKIRFDLPILKKIIFIGFPAGLQSVMYTVSNLVIQGNVNIFSTDIIAAWAAFGKIDALFWMTINSFGISITTFAGQNYGAGKIDRVRSSVRQSFMMAGIITVMMTTIFILFGDYFYILFTDDSSVIAEGMRILRIITPTFITYIAIEIFSGVTRGCGKTLIPTILTCGGICSLRILWLTFAIPVNPDISTVCYSYPISWIITSCLFVIYYIYLVRNSFKRS